ATSLAVSVARTCVDDTNVVGRALPSTDTAELSTKLLPASVTVRVAVPTPSDVGLTLVSVGAAGAAVIVSVAALDVPPPWPFIAGVLTVTLTVPSFAIPLAATAVVSCVALTY